MFSPLTQRMAKFCPVSQFSWWKWRGGKCSNLLSIVIFQGKEERTLKGSLCFEWSSMVHGLSFKPVTGLVCSNIVNQKLHYLSTALHTDSHFHFSLMQDQWRDCIVLDDTFFLVYKAALCYICAVFSPLLWIASTTSPTCGNSSIWLHTEGKQWYRRCPAICYAD